MLSFLNDFHVICIPENLDHVNLVQNKANEASSAGPVASCYYYSYHGGCLINDYLLKAPQLSNL